MTENKDIYHASRENSDRSVHTGEKPPELGGSTAVHVDAIRGVLAKLTLAHEQVNLEIKKLPGESSSKYLWRLAEALTSKLQAKLGPLFDPNRLSDAETLAIVDQYIQAAILQDMHDVTRQPDFQADNEKAFATFVAGIATHRPRVGDTFDIATFDQTERNRGFFASTRGGKVAKRETYWNTLFFPFNSSMAPALARNMLDHKNVVLLGGGNARLGEELKKQNVSLKDIVNVDPFVDTTQSGLDPVVGVSAGDRSLVEAMKQRNIGAVDEVWAEYSVPAYLQTPEEIMAMFANIDALLAPGGNARIWPTEVKSDSNDAAVNARRQAFIQSVQSLVRTGNYQLVTYRSAGRAGIVLHKLPSNK